MLILGTDARTQQTAKKSLTIYSHRAIKASVLNHSVILNKMKGLPFILKRLEKY